MNLTPINKEEFEKYSKVQGAVVKGDTVLVPREAYQKALEEIRKVFKRNLSNG